MEPSVYQAWVDKWIGALILAQITRVNDTVNNPLTYLHRQLLTKQFSITGTWKSILTSDSIVAADVVAMDSPLPLKRRGSLGSASGDITKMGMEFQLNEKQLTELDTMLAMNIAETEIVRFLFQDLPKAVQGMYERLEFMFLQGLSTGVTVVEDAENVGTGVRLDYGYKAENRFSATTAFSAATSKPLDQIKAKILDKAALDGYRITKIYTDPQTIQDIANSDQAKDLFAFNQNFVGANIPNLDGEQLNAVTVRRFGFTFVPVDRSIRVQKNGVNTPIKPWEPGTMTAVTTDNLGSYVYARLAEQNRPVAGVTYRTADDFILLSQFRMNRPSLMEVLNSQARVVPVISGVDAIYTMTSTPQA